MTNGPLRLAFISRDVARRACEKWHYSHALPTGKNVFVGVWENEKFIGVVVFGGGATPEIGSPFGLKRNEVAELVRVALDKHETPVSRIVAIAIRILRGQSPGLRVLVSFADTAQGHHGGIYQACGWIYTGGESYHVYKVNGEVVHPKTCHARYGKGGQSIPWLRKHVDPNAERVLTPPKHKYVMVLDGRMKATVDSMRLPYPKRVGSDPGDTARYHREKGGSIPTPTLTPRRRSASPPPTSIGSRTSSSPPSLRRRA